MTTNTNHIDIILGSLEGYAHDEYGGDLHALLDDGHAARGVIEDACYWRGWRHTQDLLADTLAAARTRADELAEEAAGADLYRAVIAKACDLHDRLTD